MTTREVTLASLHLEHPRWLNPRTFTGLDDDALAEFGAELKERGILDPPTVQQVEFNGDIINLVIDGQRRVRAALGVLPKTTKIEVVDRTDKPIELTWDESDEIMLEVLAMGQKREGLSSFELSEVAERMRNRDRTMSAIAEAIGRDESWVSKMLRARATASPKLMLAWRKGQVTDEQFKDLATVKDQDEQAEVAKEVVAARKTGDVAEARLRTKELVEAAKAKEKKAVSDKKTNGHANGNGHAKTSPANGGEQAEMWSPPPPVVKKTAMTPRHALEEMRDLQEKRPATHDYVKGLMDGVLYALGEKDPSEFAKPWRAYLARVSGTAKVKSKKKAAKRSRKSPARKTGKARRK